MILAVVDDLLFASKIRGAAKAAGREITFARSREKVLAGVAEKPNLVIFDLDRDALDPLGTIQEIRSTDDGDAIKLVAFVRHTSTERIAAAREAGIDVVLARSAFFPALAGMLAGQAGES